MPIEILDPTYDEGDSTFVRADRIATLAGSTVGIVSNGKQGTGRFFDAFAARLRDHHQVTTVEKLTKSNYSAPAGPDIMDSTKKWNALVSGIGD